MAVSARDFFKRKEKTLGTAKARRFDLPLSRSAGSGFLRLLIALMTVLAILGLAASFALSEMTNRWSSGLENRMTVEIPAEDADAKLIPAADVAAMTEKTVQMLNGHPAIAEAVAMTEKDVQDLIAPFLGKDLALDNIPLPGLVSVRIQEGATIDLAALERRLKTIAPQGRIDTHESWLKEVVRFTGALQFAAGLLTLIIAGTTLVAVAGGVRSKMAVHRDELELLHLMGASDSYIARQLEQHILFLAFQGGMIGLALGGVFLWLIGYVSGEMGVTLLPDFSLTLAQKGFLIGLPLVIALLAMGTARTTVLRTLSEMP